MKRNKLTLLFVAVLFAAISIACFTGAGTPVEDVASAEFVPASGYLDYELVECDANGNVLNADSLKNTCLITTNGGETKYYKLTLMLQNLPHSDVPYTDTDYFAGDIVPFDHANIDISYIRPKYYNESGARVANEDYSNMGMNSRTAEGFTFTVSKKTSDGTALVEETVAPTGSVYATQISYYLTLSGAPSSTGMDVYNAIDFSFGNNLTNSGNEYGVHFYLQNQEFSIPVLCQANGGATSLAENCLSPSIAGNDFMAFFISDTDDNSLLFYNGETPTLTSYRYSMSDVNGKYMYLPLYEEYSSFAFNFYTLDSTEWLDGETYDVSVPLAQSDVSVQTIVYNDFSLKFLIKTNGTEACVPLTITRKIYGTTVQTYTLKIVTYKHDASYYSFDLGVDNPTTAVDTYNPTLDAKQYGEDYSDAMSKLFNLKWFVDNGENGTGTTQSFDAFTEGEHSVRVEITNRLVSTYYTAMEANTTYTDAACTLQKYSAPPDDIVFDFNVIRHFATENLRTLAFEGGNRYSVVLENVEGNYMGYLNLKISGDVVDSDAVIKWGSNSENVILSDDESTVNGASQDVDIRGDGVYRVTASLETADGRVLIATAVISATIDCPTLLINKSELHLEAEEEDYSVTVGYSIDGVYTPQMSYDSYFIANSSDPSVAVLTVEEDGENQIFKIAALKEGETTINIIRMIGETYVQLVSVKVTVGEEDTYVVPSIVFAEGSKLIMYLQDVGKEINALGGDNVNGEYVFYSLDEKVATVVGNGSTAVVRPVAVGSTVVVAAYEDAVGNKTLGNITVEVVREKPTVKVSIGRSTGTSDAALNIYDDLLISAEHSYDFTYSSSATFEWYIDGNRVQNLASVAKSFTTKLAAGTHTVRVIITDTTYGISVDESKTVQIVSVTDAERVLSLSETDKLYLALSGTTYTINALLDGIIDTDYTYSWGVDNNNVVTAAVVSDKTHQVEIIPRAAGTTTLFVYVTVGTYERKNLMARLDIEVQVVESLGIVGAEDYYKPGNTGVYTLLCNGRSDFKNLNASFSTDIEGEVIAHTQNQNVVTIANLKEGYLNIAAEAAGQSTSEKLRITNVNFEQIVREILPYLLLVVAVVLLIVVAVREKKSTLQTIEIKTNKLQVAAAAVVNDIEGGANALKIKAKIKRLHRKTKRIKSLADYARDNGIDEISAVSEDAMRMLKITTATIATTDKTTDTQKLKNIVENLLQNNVARMTVEAADINRIRNQFDKEIREAKAVAASEGKGKINWKIKKSAKTTFEEYSKYLNDMRYMDNPEDGINDDDDSGADTDTDGR